TASEGANASPSRSSGATGDPAPARSARPETGLTFGQRGLHAGRSARLPRGGPQVPAAVTPAGVRRNASECDYGMSPKVSDDSLPRKSFAMDRTSAEAPS